jgi:predicted DNA-binding transcriptional regulator AlpA
MVQQGGIKMDKKDFPIMLTATEVSQILGVSKRVAYEIMDTPGFPLIKIRRSKWVNREDFFNWLNEKKIS